MPRSGYLVGWIEAATQQPVHAQFVSQLFRAITGDGPAKGMVLTSVRPIPKSRIDFSDVKVCSPTQRIGTAQQSTGSPEDPGAIPVADVCCVFACLGFCDDSLFFIFIVCAYLISVFT